MSRASERQIAARSERVHQANELIHAIARCGRRFFSYRGAVSRLELDDRGRVWFVDSFSGRRIFLHSPNSRWRGFSQGGTLRSLILNLRDYVMRGTPLLPNKLGPWPEWVCGGDLWGYGDDMEQVRAAARRLGLLKDAAVPAESGCSSLAARPVSTAGPEPRLRRRGACSTAGGAS